MFDNLRWWLVNASLQAPRKVYLEYSNELWNNQFPQCKYVGDKGISLGMGTADKPWEAGWRYTSRRSIEIFSIWEQAFPRSRTVRVLPGFVANTWINEVILTFEDAYKKADGLAIAPYVALNVQPQSTPNVSAVSQWDLNKLFQHLNTVSLPETQKAIRDNQSLAAKYKLKLLAYEGGQHLTGIQGGENDDRMTQLFQSANKDPMMGTLYEGYLNEWKSAGGDLFCHFSSTGVWNKWGSWGLFQFMDDNPNLFPKWVAIKKAVSTWK